jgi:hypothetical protein
MLCQSIHVYFHKYSHAVKEFVTAYYYSVHCTVMLRHACTSSVTLVCACLDSAAQSFTPSASQLCSAQCPSAYILLFDIICTCCILLWLHTSNSGEDACLCEVAGKLKQCIEV